MIKTVLILEGWYRIKFRDITLAMHVLPLGILYCVDFWALEIQTFSHLCIDGSLY